MLNIDELPPVRITDELKQYEKWKKTGDTGIWKPFCRDGYKNIGLAYDKLYDWRRLESRANELFECLSTHSNEFWDFLRGLLKKAKEKKAKEVWIFSPDADDDFVMTYDEGGMSHQKKTTLINDSITGNDPNRKALIVDGDIAKNVFRAHERELAFTKRFCVYDQAFKKAVEFRLRPFVDENLRRHTKYTGWYDQATFFIKNEDRVYIVNSTLNGQIEWQPRHTKVYHCV